MKRFLLITTLLFIGAASWAQCMLAPVSLTERVTNSEFIAEGRVLNSYSYWNSQHNNIYTLHEVYAFKYFKGDLGAGNRTFYVLTEGGTVGLVRQQVTSTLELHPGAMGIFLCHPSNKQLENTGSIQNYKMFEAYAGPQGFAEFDKSGLTASDIFNHYEVNPQLYNLIIDITGQKPVVISQQQGSNNAVTAAAPVITSISPTTASAGTKTVLTISGSNFGNTRGSGFVAFKNADNGGASTAQPEDVEYISWSDNEIKVEINAKAGTGKVLVDNGGEDAESGSTLTINFAHLNVVDNSDIVYQPQHIGDNGTGYTWQFYTDFANNTDAKQAFLRAFQNWRCGTLINWDIGSNTTVNTIARDNVQVIRFDVGTELPSGVLGRCSSWWSGCIQGPTTNWYVDELDIVFNDGTNWNFDVANPAFAEYDFESVAVHELGHGHQLGHVINSNEIMHYSIANGQTKRTLSSVGDLAGGNYVMDLNTSGTVCLKSIMVALNPNFCSLIPVANFGSSATSVCPGTQITFTDSSGGSTNTFNWNFGTGASPATATGKGPHTVNYSTSGKKTVQLIVGGVIGNDTSTKDDIITVLPAKPAKPASIIGPDTGCVKQQAFVTDSVANATQYTWGITGGGTTNNSKDTAVAVTFSSPGAAHTVWVKATNSCGSSDSLAKPIPVISNPAATFTFAIQKDTIFLTNTSTNANAYTWKFGNNQTNNSQNLSLIPNQSGTYQVRLLASNFCGTDSSTQQITFIKSSLAEGINKIGFALYPNPATNRVIITTGNTAYSTLTIELYDLAGRSVKQAEIANGTEMNVEGLATGMYVYKVTTRGETVATGRLVIQ